VWKRIAPFLLAAVLVVGCRTPDGPRFPLPAQDVSASIPDEFVRLVFFNTSNHALYWESGHIRIQLDGNQIPTIWLDEYIQVYAEPGEHQLLLEHLDVFMFKDRYALVLEGPEVFLEVYNGVTSTNYERVDELPPEFHSRFKPGRDPNDW
jgi:hypothetical protein